MLGVTGTFLDEITHDIPSQNWGREEWAADFDAMASIGIDTIILIRAGYRDRATFDSRVLRHRRAMLPAYVDLVDLFLEQAERHDMQMFFGTYDSGEHWLAGAYDQEVAVNKALCDEAFERYGHRRAFAGWSVSHEINAFDPGMLDVYLELSSHLRGIAALPILMSPYVKGVKQFGEDAATFESHVEDWERTLRSLRGAVDIIAFQDGHMSYVDLPRYLRAHTDLARRHGFRVWSNVETFDRDMPIKFPPIDHRLLRYKMERAEAAGVDKLVTFEFSHFMSPNAAYPAARLLFERYREWMSTP